MTTRRATRTRQPGIPAAHESVCWRCGHLIRRGDRIVPSKHWAHIQCHMNAHE